MTTVEYKLPKKLRKELAKPFGKIFEEPNAAKNVDLYLRKNRTPMLIAVGDVTAANLIKYGRFPYISIIDGKTKRGKYSANWDWLGVSKHKIKNSAAGISKDAFESIEIMIDLCVSSPFRMNKSIVYKQLKQVI